MRIYGGQPVDMGNAGALAGAPGYFPSDKEVQDRLFDYGMKNTPAGREMMQKIKQLQQTFPPSLRPGYMPQAGLMPGMTPVGNLAGLTNDVASAGFNNKLIY